MIIPIFSNPKSFVLLGEKKGFNCSRAFLGPHKDML
jgi:hypothetical protein